MIQDKGSETGTDLRSQSELAVADLKKVHANSDNGQSTYLSFAEKLDRNWSEYWFPSFMERGNGNSFFALDPAEMQ